MNLFHCSFSEVTCQNLCWSVSLYHVTMKCCVILEIFDEIREKKKKEIREFKGILIIWEKGKMREGERGTSIHLPAVQIGGSWRWNARYRAWEKSAKKIYVRTKEGRGKEKEKGTVRAQQKRTKREEEEERGRGREDKRKRTNAPLPHDTKKYLLPKIMGSFWNKVPNLIGIKAGGYVLHF